jgi:hypothetical protein
LLTFYTILIYKKPNINASIQQFLSTYKYKYKKSISYIYIYIYYLIIYGFITLYIYIYYLIKYCRAGGYPSDQNSKNRYPSVIRIFKISVSVSVRIYASGRASGSARLVGRVGFHGFLPTPSGNILFVSSD